MSFSFEEWERKWEANQKNIDHFHAQSDLHKESNEGKREYSGIDREQRELLETLRSAINKYVLREYQQHYQYIDPKTLARCGKLLQNPDISDRDPALINDPKYRLLHIIGADDRQIRELFVNQNFRSVCEWLLQTMGDIKIPSMERGRKARLLRALGRYVHKEDLDALLDYPTVLGAEVLGYTFQQLGRNTLHTFLELRDAAAHIYDPKVAGASFTPPYIPDAILVRRALNSLMERYGKDTLGRIPGDHSLAKSISTAMGDEDSLEARDIRHLLRGTGAVNGQKALTLANGLIALSQTDMPQFETIQTFEEFGKSLPPEQKRR